MSAFCAAAGVETNTRMHPTPSFACCLIRMFAWAWCMVNRGSKAKHAYHESISA